MNMIEKKITSYKMSDEVAQLVRATPLLLISAPVGGGKNTVINELLNGEGFYEIVSHTTRAPRENHGTLERDGVEYHFIDLDEADRMLDAHEFIEAKYVHGNIYGTSAQELRNAAAQAKVAVTDIDIHGVKEYLAIKPDTHAVFLLPPSVEAWLKRLERRYGNLDEHMDEVKKRFQTAHAEIKNVIEDERFVIVINDDLMTTVERIRGVMDGTYSERSDYADAVTEHLIAFLEQWLGTH